MTENRLTWEVGDFDGRGLSIIVAKKECPDMFKLPEYLVENNISLFAPDDFKAESKWCKRNQDEENVEYEIKDNRPMNRKTKKPKLGWFPVWLIRTELGE